MNGERESAARTDKNNNKKNNNKSKNKFSR